MKDQIARSSPPSGTETTKDGIFAGGSHVEADQACCSRLTTVIRRFHSEVGSPLAAVGLRLELLKEQADLDDGSRHALGEICDELGLVIDSIRGSVADLRQLQVDAGIKR